LSSFATRAVKWAKGSLQREIGCSYAVYFGATSGKVMVPLFPQPTKLTVNYPTGVGFVDLPPVGEVTVDLPPVGEVTVDLPPVGEVVIGFPSMK
jgi:hypothetical protein